MKKFLKIFLISLASLILIVAIAVSVVLWFVLTPEKLTPIVHKQAAKYIHCQTEIGEIELTFFSTFPQFGLKANRFTLINPVNGAPCDTLIDANELTAIVNFTSLVKHKELVVDNFRLSGGTACVFKNSDGHTNFDIFPVDSQPAEQDTTTDFIFKIIDIENVDLQNINIAYIDDSLRLKARIRDFSGNVTGSMKDAGIAGKINTKPFDISLEYGMDGASMLRTDIRRLSAKIDGSLKSGVISGTVDVQPVDIMLDYDSDSLKLHTDIRNFSAAISGSSGNDRINGNIRLVPFNITLDFNNERYLQDATVQLNTVAEVILSRQLISLKETSLSVNDLNIDLAGTVENDTPNQDIHTDISYKFDTWPVKSIISLVPQSFSSYLKGIGIDGKLSSGGTINGVYNSSSMPMMDIRVLFENGTFKYDGLQLSLNSIQGDINVHTDLKDPQSYVRINHFGAKTPKSSFKTAGTVNHLFTDLRANLSTDVDLVLSEFAPLIPDSMKVTAEGTVSGKVKTDFTMSQVTKMQLEKMKLSGSVSVSDLDVVYDSLSLKTDRSVIDFALPNPKPSSTGTGFVFANISSTVLKADKINSFHAALENAVLSLEASNVRDTTRIPDILCSFGMDNLVAGIDSIHVAATKPSGKISVAPLPDTPQQPAIELNYQGGQLKAGLEEHSIIARKINLDAGVKYDPAQKDMVLQWSPKGFIDIERIGVTTSATRYPIAIPAIKLEFDPEVFTIEKADIRLGKSDFSLRGKLSNVSSYFRDDSLLVGDFDFISNMTDILQIMKITSGIGTEVNVASDQENQDDSFSDTYMVPQGIDILLRTNIDNAAFGPTTSASDIKGEVRVRDGVLALEGLTFKTPAADMQLTAMYRTPRKNHLFLGLDFHMLDVEISELLEMLPQVDSIMPMLRSFGGKGEFHVAAETYLDSLYNLKKSTLLGAASIRGTDLVLMDGETFSEIAKSLRFNKKTENKVDSLSAEFTIFRQEVDVYPFLIVMDKYKAVVAGRHNLDMTFDYNISVVESPLPFRLAVNVRGTPEKMKFGLGKSKYPDFYRPVSRKVVENKQLELRKMIRDALVKKVKEE